MSKLPSKNTKCPCGSGKRYRQCHGRAKLVMIRAAERFRQMEEARQNYVDKHGYARPPVTATWNGKRMIVVGGNIYMQTEDRPYGVGNVAHDCALELFGQDYINAQEKLKDDERHPAMQWLFLFLAHEDMLVATGNTDPMAHMIGAGGAWIRFGYDLFTIRDNAKLQSCLTERLLNIEYFQGARYELAVAAICIAAGFEIDFEDETDNERMHPEFIGTDRSTGAKIAVEAKSRRRHGVKGFEGGYKVDPGESVGIRSLVLGGFRKENGLPLYIFVDTNLPAADEEMYARWMTEVDGTMTDLAQEGYMDPCQANAVYFTNDPSHYGLRTIVSDQAHQLWFKTHEPRSVLVPAPSADMSERFCAAFMKRAVPPKDFPDI